MLVIRTPRSSRENSDVKKLLRYLDQIAPDTKVINVNTLSHNTVKRVPTLILKKDRLVGFSAIYKYYHAPTPTAKVCNEDYLAYATQILTENDEPVVEYNQRPPPSSTSTDISDDTLMKYLSDKA